MTPTAPTLALLALMAGPAMAAPQVVTDLMPTGALVQDVMGDLGQVRVLLPQGASAHHHQMRPSDAQALQSADLVVWMGPFLTPWLDRAAANLSPADQLRLLQVQGTALRPFDSQAAHDHDQGDGGPEDSAADTDPHAWLDPDNAPVWLRAIAADLSARDPQNARTYQQNADAAIARIAQVDTDLRQTLTPFAKAQFVVFHDAYGYFTDHFGLQPGLAVALGDASTPSAARIDQIRQQIADSGAVCAFPELSQDPRLLATVSEGSDLRLGGELSPEGGELPPGAGQYDALLTDMGQTIATCLGGS